MNTIMGLVKEMKLVTDHQEFGLTCNMTIRVDLEQESLLLNRLQLIESCRYSRAANDL